MKVLVFCEYSDVVGSAFRAKGHDVTSADLLPSEGSPNHYQGDGRWLLQEPWDLVVAHPPCTYLSVARGEPSDDEDEVLAALEFFADCQNANAPRVAVENPGIYRFAQKVLGKPSQVVQPWHFGDAYIKRTCWWLQGLPPLFAQYGGSDRAILSKHISATGCKPGEGVRNPSARAKFWQGMAAAMAHQWGGL